MYCQGSMKKVISASRRTDLVASFPAWLSQVVQKGRADVIGPRGSVYSVDLSPDSVHTLVLWSKNYANLIEDRFGLRRSLLSYTQLYAHFTITGLGGGPWERGTVTPDTALAQLKELIEVIKGPERVSVRFDPIVFWQEEEGLRTNLDFFKELAPELAACIEAATRVWASPIPTTPMIVPVIRYCLDIILWY